MIHKASATKILREKFGNSRFSARRAAEALSYYTLGTTFVALSTLVKAGLLERVKKGEYVLKDETAGSILSLKQLERPNITFPQGSYATATYALSTVLSPVSPSRYLDIFVRPIDYPHATPGLEVKAFPMPRVHPFATRKAPMTKSIDGFPITPPEAAFVDLVRIASDKRRPVNFEDELVPFIPQLLHRWSKVTELAERWDVQDCLDAIVFYVRRVAFESGFGGMKLPKPITHYNGFIKKTLSFVGRKVDDASIEIGKRTGVIVEADREAVKSVLGNI